MGDGPFWPYGVFNKDAAFYIAPFWRDTDGESGFSNRNGGFLGRKFRKISKDFFRISKGSKRLHRALRSSGPAQLALFSIGNALVGRIGGRNGATPPYLLRICKIFEFLSQFFFVFFSIGEEAQYFCADIRVSIDPIHHGVGALWRHVSVCSHHPQRPLAGRFGARGAQVKETSLGVTMVQGV